MAEAQATVCQCLGKADIEKMRALARDAERERVEHGAPLLSPCSVGESIRGKAGSVEIPRPANALGSFHTHTTDTRPSVADLMDMMAAGDKVSCIGLAQTRMPKVDCYIPNDAQRDKYQGLGLLSRFIREDVREYTEGLTKAHGKLAAVSLEERVKGLELKSRAEALRREIETWREELLTKCSV